MAITHVRFVHSKIPPDWESRSFEDLEKDRHILLVDMVPEGTETKPGQMYRVLDPAIKGNDCVVLRGAWPHIKHAVSRDPGLQDEVGERPAMALVGGTRPDHPGPALVALPGFRPIDQPLSMESLRQAELEALLFRTGAVYTDEAVHYGLPSTYHAEKFIRLADALRSIHDVSRVVDWVMEHVRPETIVVADTGSLLPLLYHLRDEAARRFRWRIEVASLDQYPRDKMNIIDAVDAIKNRPDIAWRIARGGNPPAEEATGGLKGWLLRQLRSITARVREEFRIMTQGGRTEVRRREAPAKDPHFLFLVSVSSTGSLCNHFRELRLSPSTILIVCETSRANAQQPAGSPRDECDTLLVRIPIDRWPIDTTGKCKTCADKPVIHVHHVSYELVPRYEPKLVRVTPGLAQAKYDFWRIANQEDAVKLHYDADYSGHERHRGRHFSVYLDTAKLAKNAEFRAKCKAQLPQSRPDVLLIPEHAHSAVVRDLCLEAYPGLTWFFIPPSRLRAEVVESLRSATRILVADDAVITGTTLVNLRAEIFRVTQLLKKSSVEVNAFVMLLRPATRHPIDAMNRRYMGQEIRKLLRGEELYLPDGQQCPWCKEERLLGRFVRDLPENSQRNVELRLEKLAGRPITAPLMMVQTHDADGGLITHDSLFGELRHVTAFAAGSCAAQTLKLGLGTSGGGIQFAIAEISHAIQAYYESPLLGSLLRNFDRVDARFPGSDPAVEEAIRILHPQQAYPGTLAELALATIEGKVPGSELKKHLDREKGNDSWLQMFADLFEVVCPI